MRLLIELKGGAIMGERITYNIELMDEITTKYNEGYDKLDDAITEFELFKNSFKTCYDGQVNVEIFETISTTLKSHLELLQLCYFNMGEYVTAAKEDMVATDETISNGMNGTSQGNGGGNNG